MFFAISIPPHASSNPTSQGPINEYQPHRSCSVRNHPVHLTRCIRGRLRTRDSNRGIRACAEDRPTTRSGQVLPRAVGGHRSSISRQRQSRYRPVHGRRRRESCARLLRRTRLQWRLCRGRKGWRRNLRRSRLVVSNPDGGRQGEMVGMAVEPLVQCRRDSNAGSVRVAVRGAWPRVRGIWWTRCSARAPCGSGC